MTDDRQTSRRIDHAETARDVVITLEQFSSGGAIPIGVVLEVMQDVVGLQGYRAGAAIADALDLGLLHDPVPGLLKSSAARADVDADDLRDDADAG